MSIKERIRALNLQSGGGGGYAPDSPTRKHHSNSNRQLNSFKTPSTPSVPLSAAESSIPEPSSPLPSTKSPLRSSPTSEKAQLFKAAKVIRKAFDAGSGPNFLEPSSPNSRHTTADEAEEGDDSFGFDNSAEFDATAALKGWRAKGMVIDEPSFHDVGSHTNEKVDNTSIDDDTTTPGIASQLEIRDASADSSPERKASRVDGTRSLANGGETATPADHDTNEQNLSRPIDAVSSDEKIITPSGNDVGELRYESKSSSQYSMSGGGTYRAYGRRSRLRSPRSSGTSSSDLHSFVDGMDGAQSVTSAQSALSQTSLSQISSLSTRATRFLKDKKDRRKEAAFLTTGGEDAIDRKFDELAQDIVHNTLRGGASTETIIQKAGVDDSKNNGSLSNHSSKEWKTGGSMGRPQTVDIRPSIPKLGEYISDLNRDVGYHDQFEAQSNHDERQLTPTYDEFQRINPRSELKDYPPKDDTTSQHRCDQTASLDESSCSELKATDLFDTSRKRGSDLKKQSAFNRLDGAGSESHSDFTPFQHGVGKSFDTGCNVLESMNPLPLIESAFNALSARSQSNGAFFINANSGVARSTPPDDAPFDEDAMPPDEPIGETVAIEVEYVEHGDEHQSFAETDSIFSVSTRDLESFNA